MSDRPDLDEAIKIAMARGLKITGGKYAPQNQPPSHLSSEDELDKILGAKPTNKEVPESIWGDIHATWTGLWTDSWGEWDELQASDLFPISDLLSEERQTWLKQQILSLIATREAEVRVTRVWAMPSRWTYTIKPITELLNDEVMGVSVDPFAGKSELAHYRNDLETDQPNKQDALEWLKSLSDNLADTVLYDPPYSITQAAKYNSKFASKAYWSACKKELGRILKPGGTAISFGWNSGGLGKVNSCEIRRILLVAHGGNRNDTIVTVETKLNTTNSTKSKEVI